MDRAIIATILVVTLVALAEAVRAYKKTGTLSAFFLMDGKLSVGFFVGTLASTNFSLGNMIFLSLIWGFFYGLSGTLWLWIGFGIAAIVFVWFVKCHPQVREYIEDESNCGSVHEYLQKSFVSGATESNARRIRLAASLATILCLLLALTLEIYLASSILAPLTGVDASVLMVALTALICIYSGIGGFRAVVFTDMMQGLLLVLAMLGIGLIVLTLRLPLNSYSDIHPVSLKGFLLAPGWKGIASILIVTFGWYLVSMDTWQRACASRNSRTVVTGTIVGQIPLFIGILVFTLVGAFDRLAIDPALTTEQAALFSQGYNPLADLYLITDQLAPWGQALMGFIAVALVMAGLSTADTFLLVCGHSFVSDLLVGIGKHSTFAQLSEAENRLFTGVGRAAIIVMGLIVMALLPLLGWLELLDNPLALFYLAYSIQFALLAPVVASLWKKKPPTGGVLLALLLGIAASLAWGFGFSIAGTTGWQGIWGITVDEFVYFAPAPPIIVGFAVILLSRIAANRRAGESER